MKKIIALALLALPLFAVEGKTPNTCKAVVQAPKTAEQKLADEKSAATNTQLMLVDGFDDFNDTVTTLIQAKADMDCGKKTLTEEMVKPAVDRDQDLMRAALQQYKAGAVSLKKTEEDEDPRDVSNFRANLTLSLNDGTIDRDAYDIGKASISVYQTMMDMAPTQNTLAIVASAKAFLISPEAKGNVVVTTNGGIRKRSLILDLLTKK